MATVATAVGAMAGMAEKRDLYFGRTTILPLAVSRRVDVGFGSDDQNGQRAIQTFRSVGQTDRRTTSGPSQFLSYMVYVTSYMNTWTYLRLQWMILIIG